MSTVDVLVVYPMNRAYYSAEEAFGLTRSLSAGYLVSSSAFEREARCRVRYFYPAYRPRWPGIAGHEIANSRVANLKEIIRSLRPRIVVTYELFSGLSGDVSRIKRHQDFRHVVVAYETTSLRNGLWGTFPPSILSAISVRGTADLFIAYSARIRQALYESGVDNDRIVTIPPGVFVADFAVHNSNRTLEARTVVYLGALRPNKGVEVLLRSIDLANESSESPIQLRVAGTGPLEGEVRRWCKERTFGNYVGAVSGKDKIEFLASGTVLAYPSIDVRLAGRRRWEEQVGFSVIEAMATGLCVIVSDSGSLPEVVGREDAVVPQNDSVSLSNALLNILDNKKHRAELSAFFQTRARTRFDILTSASLLETALARLA